MILIIMIKIIVSGRHEYQALIDVVDPTDHIAMGGIKNARHIATQMILAMLRVGPNKRLFDMVSFVGTSSV